MGLFVGLVVMNPAVAHSTGEMWYRGFQDPLRVMLALYMKSDTLRGQVTARKISPKPWEAKKTRREATEQAVEDLCRLDALTPTQKEQLRLPLKAGGLGLRVRVLEHLVAPPVEVLVHLRQPRVHLGRPARGRTKPSLYPRQQNTSPIGIQ